MTPITAFPSAREALRDAQVEASKVDLGRHEDAVDPRRWTLSRDVLRLLSALIKRLQPRHILEFGSGLSTQVLIEATRDLDTAISSIDHDPEYGAAAARRAAEEAERPRLACQIAPLVCRPFGGDPLPAYLIDRNRLACTEPVDLALIDGPPELLGGRAGTLYQIMDYARSGALVLLDDAHRSGEREALRRWQAALGDAIEIVHLQGFEKGLAAIFVRQPVPVSDLWRHREQLAVRDLLAAVPAGQHLVLLDSQQWDRSQLQSHRISGLFDEKGQEGGTPCDDRQAVAWLAETKRRGARFCAVGWPAFWWRQAYPEFWRELERTARRLLDNGRVIVFRIAPEGPDV